MKLAIFDVDGTLVDSQQLIHSGMTMAFEDAGLPPPALADVLATVGLSLDVAIARLVPDADIAMQARIVDGYKDVFTKGRIAENAPLYPGALDCLKSLAARDDLLLAVATGKGRRGLQAMIDAHDLHGIFITMQTADNHPSKPNPAMLLSALSETGVDAENAVMIGDTSFDMEMARAAGISGFGVDWGYHPASDLQESGAALIASDFVELTTAIGTWLK